MELAQESGKGGGQMEQTLVVYSSETGFTQRFALCIAQTLHCEMIDVQFLTASDLKNRSLVIYGGHLVGNKVLGLKSFYRQRRFAWTIYCVRQRGCPARVRELSTDCAVSAESSVSMHPFLLSARASKTESNEPLLADSGCVGIKTLRKPILPSGSRRHSSAGFGCDSGIESLICYWYRWKPTVVLTSVGSVFCEREPACLEVGVL